MQTGHQHRSRGSTNGAAGIMLGEQHASFGECINIGSLEFCLSIAAQVTVTKIIGQDVNNIRLLALLSRASRCQQADGCHLSHDQRKDFHQMALRVRGSGRNKVRHRLMRKFQSST